MHRGREAKVLLFTLCDELGEGAMLVNLDLRPDYPIRPCPSPRARRRTWTTASELPSPHSRPMAGRLKRANGRAVG